MAREHGVVAGLSIAVAVFPMLDSSISIALEVSEGVGVAEGTVLATVEGAAAPILTGERTALNLLGRLCGIATRTAEVVSLVAHTGASVAATRKTTPGLRFGEVCSRVRRRTTTSVWPLRRRPDQGQPPRRRGQHRCRGESRPIGRRRGSSGRGRSDHPRRTRRGDPRWRRRGSARQHESGDGRKLRCAQARGRVVLEASGGITPESIVVYAETGSTSSHWDGSPTASQPSMWRWTSNRHQAPGTRHQPERTREENRSRATGNG